MAGKIKMPEISMDRIDISPPINTQIGHNKEERRAKAFIKGKEPKQITSLRVPEGQYEKLDKISFVTKKSINNIINKAIDEYLEKEDIQRILKKRTDLI